MDPLVVVTRIERLIAQERGRHERLKLRALDVIKQKKGAVCLKCVRKARGALKEVFLPKERQPYLVMADKQAALIASGTLTVKPCRAHCRSKKKDGRA